MSSPPKPHFPAIESITAAVMFVLAALFLLQFALLIHYLQTDAAFEQLPVWDDLRSIVFIFWPLFFLQRLFWIAFCQRRRWQDYMFALSILLIPPLQFASRRCHDVDQIWLGWSWHQVSPELYKEIQPFFLYSVLVTSTIMIPFWLLELLAPRFLSNNPFIYHFLNIGNAIVWSIFVTELIIMLSIIEKKREYLIKHWLELLIIVLPMFALLRFVRLANTARLIKLLKTQRMLNLYRSRSVLNRLVAIILFFQIIERWQQHRDPESYKQRLEEKLAEKEQEVAEIKQKIIETEKLIAQRETEHSDKNNGHH